MKKALFALLILLLCAGSFLYSRAQSEPAVTTLLGNVTPQPTIGKARTPVTSLFVPYWSLNKPGLAQKDYDEIIYFGVAPTASGINTKEAGYLNLEKFTSQVASSQKTYLTLRMLNADNNFAILKDKKKQQAVIADTVALAKEHNFAGVVLDLELSALPFESLIQQINGFTKDFSAAVKEEELSFAMTFYGDTFYRVRPFEVKTLAQYTDQVMIMAYDFHKAGGNPGPNFPLGGKDKYGYDYATLVENFSSAVSPDKITVIFGLFGYDWRVDDKNIAQEIGKALSYGEIQETIVTNCTKLQCSIRRDAVSGETVITYIDSEKQKHMVWFEDPESVEAKQHFLKTKGVKSFSFWAYSYF